MIKGNLDLVSRQKIAGWAFDPQAPARPLSLVITRNGVFVGRLIANRYRADLQAAGIGDGKHSFEFSFATELPPFAAQEVSVVCEGDGVHVPKSPAVLPAVQTFEPAEREALARYLGAEGTEDVITAKIDFLAVQLDALLQRRAGQISERRNRDRYRDLQLRWGKQGLEHEPVPADLPNARPRALFIDDHVPQLDRDAGSNAIVSHIQSLQRLGFSTTFVPARAFRAPDSAAHALEQLGVECCAAPYYASVEEVLRRQAGQFELIYLHRVQNAAKYGALAREFQPAAAIVYSVADLHHLRIARQSDVEQRPELKSLARRLRLAELTATATSDVVITHSDQETKLLQDAVPHASVVSVRWTVTPQPVQTSFEARHGIAFIGGFGHDPNRDAARWLISEIVPLIRRMAPIECLLVGSDLPADILRLCGEGVTAIGHVPDLRDIFNRVRMTIAPLAYGAGVKGKVLESFAAGLPCACTSVAIEGIPLGPELRACVADDAPGLAELVVKMHGDAAANEAAAEAGLGLIRELCSEQSVDASMRLAIGRHFPGLRMPGLHNPG